MFRNNVCRYLNLLLILLLLSGQGFREFVRDNENRLNYAVKS